MTAPSLEVLIVEGDEPITAALEAALARRGHRVRTARDVEGALAQESPDVVVCEARLPGGSAFDLLTAIAERGDRARSVLLLSEPTVEDCLRASRLGAAALLTKPFRVADLLRAVEAAPVPRSIDEGPVFDRRYAPEAASAVDCARDLSAFCLRRAVPASVRARIAGAACEIVDNAARHAQLASTARIRVRGRVADRWLSLEIEDSGRGFEPHAKESAGSSGPALAGFARAEALSDAFEVDSAPGAGTRVRLRFCIASITFSDGDRDLSEADFLLPREARDVLEALLDGETPEITGISPAIAVVLGRLLAGPDPRAPHDQFLGPAAKSARLS